jgi:dipeptidyl aminopeptidase/acylaminoacyl peptidase
VTQAGKVKAAVFIAAGGMDRRVPVAHAKAMKKALEKAGNSPQYLVMPLEGHGFNEPESRRELYSAMLTFLDAQIGGAKGEE